MTLRADLGTSGSVMSIPLLTDLIVDTLERGRAIADVVPGVTKTTTGFEAARAGASMTA